MDEVKVPRWQKLVALTVAAAIAIVVAAWHGRLAADFWPPDASRIAPNIIASVVQWAVILLVLALVWPPTRRRIHQFADRKLAPIHDHLTAIRANHLEHMAAIRTHHDDHAASLDELHRTLAHIVKHLPIPDIPDKETP